MVELGAITEQEKDTYCIKLKRSMYGSADAPLRWLRTLSAYLVEIWISKSETDPCMFYKREEKTQKLSFVASLYVDNTNYSGNT